jgi:uncharacterized protein
MTAWLTRLRSVVNARILVRIWLPCLVLASVAGNLCAAGQAQALAVPPAPTDIPVVDQTKTLTDEQKQQLAAKIAKERAATGNQIAVLMISSLQGEAIEDYSLQVARGWGIGQKDRNSGVLLLVAKDDRRLRIEVGYGLEGALTDIRSGQIIRDRITPQFKTGNYFLGISNGLDSIITAIHGEKDPNLKPEAASDRKGSGIWSIIGNVWWLFILIPVWLSSILGRTKSWWAGGVLGGVAGGVIGIFAGFVFTGLAAIIGLAIIGLVFDRFVSKNYQQAASGGRSRPSWWAGGPWIGGGGTGGSSGGGFGGGSFGGGGSSGSW